MKLPNDLKLVAPGIWKMRIGTPEAITPVTIRDTQPRLDAIASLPIVDSSPLVESTISARNSTRGLVIEIPCSDNEQFFGLGLQLKSFNQTGLKKTLRVNSDPVADTGDSHAPVPFYISDRGYGVYIDTARYATFYFAAHSKRGSSKAKTESDSIATNTEDLYAKKAGVDRSVVIEIPCTQGVDLYIFAGPAPLNAVQRYNLYSGGGCLPPMWGLGIWYRAYGPAHQIEVTLLAKSFRDHQLPCDVIGLEPGWQTKAYSCSFVWSPERFPRPDEFLSDMKSQGFKINLWEHVFVHPSSPLHEPLLPLSGSEEVWNGLVPDLLKPEARKIFGNYHRSIFVDKGVSGFKLDECDNSDFIHSPWSFPETSTFPSGLDGEQMHALLGILYQRTILDGFQQSGHRTFSAVRSSGSFAAPYPFVLYSDLYNHRDFIRGLVNCGFSGILWTPEVRDATSAEDLLRRIQSVIFSPQALINAWYIKNPPWLQFDTRENNEGHFLANAQEFESSVRKLFQLRMSLLPYLYSAFANYYFRGLPPFRALILDYPADPACHKIDDQFMMGEDLLVAPIFAGQVERKVYLPEGDWYDFHSHQKYPGQQWHTIQADLQTIPLFVKSKAILPIAVPVDHVDPDTTFDITPTTFGSLETLRIASLFEDDGLSCQYQSNQFNWLVLHPDRTVTRSGLFPKQRYRITEWIAVP
jgi:alpha-D-xyloside xylohydrolase